MTPPVPHMSTRKKAQLAALQSTLAPVRKLMKAASVQKSDVDLHRLVRRYRKIHLEDWQPGADVSWQQWEVWRDMATSEEVGADF